MLADALKTMLGGAGADLLLARVGRIRSFGRQIVLR
jgi:hypothetical protein